MVKSLRRWIPAALLLAIVVAIVAPLSALAPGDAPAQQPAADLIALGMKFEGAMTCNNAKCHGMNPPAAAPKPAGNEAVVWLDKDPHALSYRALTKPKDPANSKIAKDLGIAEPQNSARCLNCHALDAPAALRGKEFNIKEGNSCANCHGPSEKWNQPHATPGWIEGERKKFPKHGDLLKNWGIYDTVPAVERAERCVNCHIEIDAELVAKGHPKARFELDFFSQYSNFDENFARHWRVTEEDDSARLWAAGQVVCVRDAMKQLASRLKAGAEAAAITDAYNQAMGHLLSLNQLIETKAIAADGAAMSAAAKSLGEAMKAGGKDAAIAAATTIAAEADKLKGAVSAFKPDKAKSAALLAAVVANKDAAGQYGGRGAEQQALAVLALYKSHAKASGVAEDAKMIESLMGLLGIATDEKFNAEEYAKALAGVKLP